MICELQSFWFNEIDTSVQVFLTPGFALSELINVDHTLGFSTVVES